MMCCVIFNACNTQNTPATLSGTLIDVEGKPIANHIVTLYPIKMGDTGSAKYQPITTIATSPEFITARTNKDGSFAFREKISQGMIRIGLISPDTLKKLRKPDLKDFDFNTKYELISVKIGVMTFYGDEQGPGSTTFSLLTDQKMDNVVIVARREMWIEGKIVFNDRKPLTDAPVTFKTSTRLKDKTGESRYGDRIHRTDSKGNFLLDIFYHSEPKLYKVSAEYHGLSAESKEFLIKGSTQHKGLILKLNGDRNDIPENPKPLEPLPFPGMVSLPKKLTPEQWIVNPHNGHAYAKILCENFEAAKDRAFAESAYLVAINDEDEQKWISSAFGYELYWIGLQNNEEGKWMWVSDEPITYTNWGPEDRFVEDILRKGEKEAAVMTFVEGEWHAVAPGDLFWTYTRRAILEKDSWHTGTPSEDR